jgi:hypothetical protein
MKETTKKKIFLSHSYLDREIATRIIDKLIIPIFNIDKQIDIFFTSKRETGIESSINWRNRIKSNLQDCDIFIALFTSNFKESEMCLGEVGAAWVLNKKIYPFILPPVKYENFSVVISELQADILLKKEDLESFVNSIGGDLKRLHNIDYKPNLNIEKCIDSFLKSTKQYLHRNPNLFKPISVEAKKEQKQEVIKEIKEILETANPSINGEEKKMIKERSKIEWPDDYSMQEYYIDQQIDALTNLRELQTKVKGIPEKVRIVEKAINEWPKDYTMQLYKAEEEINAYMRLQ